MYKLMRTPASVISINGIGISLPERQLIRELGRELEELVSLIRKSGVTSAQWNVPIAGARIERMIEDLGGFTAMTFEPKVRESAEESIERLRLLFREISDREANRVERQGYLVMKVFREKRRMRNLRRA